jgi:hypothetical protein
MAAEENPWNNVNGLNVGDVIPVPSPAGTQYWRVIEIQNRIPVFAPATETEFREASVTHLQPVAGEFSQIQGCAVHGALLETAKALRVAKNEGFIGIDAARTVFATVLKNLGLTDA